jgi:hypothetical protein
LAAIGRLLGGIDLGHAVGNLEAQDFGRPVQSLAVRGRLEDAAFIGALALEHAGGIVQAVGEDMDLGVAPGHQLAVEPDDAVAIVEGQHAHGKAPSLAVPFALAMGIRIGRICQHG